MRRLLIVIFLLDCITCMYAQSLSQPSPVHIRKPAIDTSILGKWPYLSNACISNDGTYVSYSIEMEPVGGRTLVIQSTTGSWKKEFINASPGNFTGDNKQYIFMKNDTLFFLPLGANNLSFIPNVISYKQPKSNKAGWLAYQVIKPNKALILRNLFTSKEQSFVSVTDYLFNDIGNVLLLKTESDEEKKPFTELFWIDLNKNITTNIWSTDDNSNKDALLKNFYFDLAGSQLVFVVQKKNSTSFDNSIWYYKANKDKAVIQVHADAISIGSGLKIASDLGLKFSQNGQYIFFQLEKVEEFKSKPDMVQVDVWNYKDVILQSEQLKHHATKTFAAVSKIGDKHMIRLQENEGERILTSPDQVKDNYIVISENNPPKYTWWEADNKLTYYLTSLRDGSRKLLGKSALVDYSISLSPENHYLIYWDKNERNYFTYDMLSGKINNISKSISAKLIREESRLDRFSSPVGVAGWLDQDTALLVYDNYDIWQLDPAGIKSPINVTNGYGRLHQIKLRLMYGSEETGGIKADESLLMVAFCPVNKYNGFYLKKLTKKGDPELLSMGPYTFNHKMSSIFFSQELDDGMIPLKAADANVWIVKRMNASEAPNFFLTSDFKSYKALTYLQPQKAYNWLTAELVTWKQLDGKNCQGILYKPEDFDSRKRYPVIFNYYEQRSHRLYEFPRPDFIHGNIDIPWFVSNGYLVFTPDYHQSIATVSGKTNEDNIFNSVVSAVNYLTQRSWIDPKKIAIQGHSHGGFLTNYLITKTNLFAAAAEAAGGSDYVNCYLSISLRGRNLLQGVETGQGRIGATLWGRPDLYLRKSSVLKANKVNTPLFIMHNKADYAVPWAQGLEMFMALYRLNKKVWMVQYDNGDHEVGGKEAVDYTIRLTQFFDHYLKGTAPPSWMTTGIPASMKGIDSGYSLDPNGKCGKDCKICQK